jgi:hypothetical protein
MLADFDKTLWLPNRRKYIEFLRALWHCNHNKNSKNATQELRNMFATAINAHTGDTAEYYILNDENIHIGQKEFDYLYQETKNIGAPYKIINIYKYHQNKKLHGAEELIPSNPAGHAAFVCAANGFVNHFVKNKYFCLEC